MFFTIYKTTNIVNSKVYIGKHKTNYLKDDYLGSGLLLHHAIEKYGKENFVKEILYIFDNEDEMNAKEAELVNEEFVANTTNYNIALGGQGGWYHINSIRTEEEHREISKLGGLSGGEFLKEYTQTDEYKSANSDRMKIKWELGHYADMQMPSTLGLKYSDETKKLISISQSGAKNSQFGTIWITNGTANKKIKSTDSIPNGWYRGRKMLQ